MTVLYVNHTAAVSGAERALLDLLGGLPPSVETIVASPRGRLEQDLRGLGIATTAIPGTAGSLRAHPLYTPVAVAQMAAAASALRLAARVQRADLVHANSIRAGIVLGLARPPAARVVHVRDCLPAGAMSRGAQRLIAASATTVVANSRYTANVFERAAPGAQHVEVVHDPVDLRRFDPAHIDRVQARGRLGAAGRCALLLGVVAQLTPWKGQDTAIEALGILRSEGVDAHLLLIGSAKFLARATRFDNEAYVDRLRSLVSRNGLEEHVSWLGERQDIPELIRALDVLLVPSWEEPFGLTLIEAMALEVPVLATSIGGPPEIIGDGREGFLVAPRQPAAWARAIGRLAEGPELRAQMGRAGRARVEDGFTVEHHVRAMLDVYDRALARRGAGVR